MQRKLAIIALGHRNSGKSRTWYELFGRVIRTGWKRMIINNQLRIVYFRNGSYEELGDEIGEDLFIRNASLEETGDQAEEYFDNLNNQPYLLFCSVQYVEKGMNTIKWLRSNGYTLYIQWLNPGYHGEPYEDYLHFEKEFGTDHTLIKVSGKSVTERVNTIKEVLFGWYNSI